MTTAATTAAATTRLVLPDHAEAVMRQIEDLQWTETFSDLTIHVSQPIMSYVVINQFTFQPAQFRFSVKMVWYGPTALWYAPPVRC